MNEPLDPYLVEGALLHYAEEQWGEPWIDEYVNYHSHVPGTQFEIPGLGTVTLVDFKSWDTDKNYDGWYEDVWMVFDVRGTLYRKSGRHTSYSGTEWDDSLEIVVPKTKTVTYYEEA